MTKTITAAEREAVRRYICDVFHCTTCDWLNGYEALVVHMENRFEQHAAMAIRKQHNLECRLKIAGTALKCVLDELIDDDFSSKHAQRIISEALAAMAKEEKSQ
jgi:hypothetical protein